MLPVAQGTATASCSTHGHHRGRTLLDLVARRRASVLLVLPRAGAGDVRRAARRPRHHDGHGATIALREYMHRVRSQARHLWVRAKGAHAELGGGHGPFGTGCRELRATAVARMHPGADPAMTLTPALPLPAYRRDPGGIGQPRSVTRLTPRRATSGQGPPVRAAAKPSRPSAHRAADLASIIRARERLSQPSWALSGSRVARRSPQCGAEP
jgi:hypothetical protein